MTETPHQPCPYTACGSSDAFSWNAELQVGKCHSCSRGYPSKDEMFPWAKSTYPYKDKSHKREPASVTYEGVRGIAPDVAKLYGIQMQLDADGDPLQYAFKYKNNIKYRDMTLPDQKGKKIWMKDKGKKILDLFGPEFNSGSSKRLYLTEGEFDAASLYQILGKTYPVLSLPSSSISDDFIKHCHDKLDSFQELVYAGELDHAGKGAIERLYRAYAKKLYFVPMTKHKDANAFLMANDSDELKWAALKPQRYSPDNFFCSESEFLKILREENPYEAVPTGHTSVDYMIRGLVKGGLTFLKAPPGVGKSEIMRYFERAMLQEDGVKIAMIHMEEQKSTTLRAMATYELGVNVRTKDDQQENGVSDADVEAATLKAAKGDRTIIFEMRAHDNPLEIVEYCRLAAGVYGAQFIFIDHVQRLTYLAGPENATNVLTQVAANLAQLAKEFNIGIILISHVNEEGRTKYASSLEEEAIICIEVSRDKKSDNELERNVTNFEISKNRPFSRLGSAGKVFFDSKTTILEEYTFDSDSLAGGDDED